MAGVRSRNADASTSRTPLRAYRSATAPSNSGSLGLWIRLKPNGLPARLRVTRSTAASTTAGGRPAAPKEPARPRLPHRLDDPGRADAVGHRPGDVGVAQAVVGAEGGVAQILGPAGGDDGDDRQRPRARPAAELRRAALGQGRAVV